MEDERREATELHVVDREGMEDWRLRKTIKEEKVIVDAEIDEYQRLQ